MASNILITLLPPAVLFAVLAYLIRFFGKLIADQKPFADNREWDVELTGTLFVVSIIQGVVGFAAAWYGPHPSTYLWVHILDLVAVIFLFFLTSSINNALSEEYFKISLPVFRGEQKKLAGFLVRIGKKFPISVVSIFLFYIGTMEYLSGSLIWMVLIWTTLFTILLQLALIYSFQKNSGERTAVDVYFIDPTRESLRSVLILKVNNDNIRLRQGNSILILNKNQVLKMVIPVSEKYLDPNVER